MRLVQLLLAVIAAAMLLLAWSAFVPVRAQLSSVKCTGKLVPSAGFDMKTSINPMYDVTFKCE